MRLRSSLFLYLAYGLVWTFMLGSTITVSAQTVQMAIESADASCGEQVCLNVRVQDFDNILTFQYTLSWDANLLGAATVGQFGVPDLGTSNFNTTQPGIIRVGWDDTSLSGITLSDNQRIFQVCFNVPDNVSGSTNVEFANAPIPIEIIDANGNNVSPDFRNGLVNIACATGGGSTNEDFSFEINTVNANCGTQACVEVSTSGFRDILSFQHSLNWDASALSSAQIRSFGIPDMSAENFNTTVPGQLRMGWDDSSLNGVSLTDDFILYEVCFDVSPNATSGLAAISLTNTPTVIEVADAAGNLVTPSLQNGGINISCENTGGTTTPPAALSFTASNATANCGEQVCVDVITSGFQDILSFQYSINWDASLLGVGSVQQFGLANLNAANFNTSVPGTMQVGWDDPSLQGIDVADGQLLFQLCFTGNNDNRASIVQFSGSPLTLEVVNAAGTTLTPSFTNGQVAITCTDTGGTTDPPATLGFAASTATANCGEQVCVDISTTGFQDILSFQYSVNWDASLLGTGTVQQFGLANLSAANFNTSVPGTMQVGWDDPSLQGIDVAEGQVLFQLCFTGNNENRASIVQFSNTPIQIEAVNAAGVQVTPTFNNGQVNINCTNTGGTDAGGGTPATAVDMAISSASGTCGNAVCFDVTTSGFTNIVSFQHSINWDGAQLGAARVSQVGIRDLNTPNFNTSAAGQLSVGWDDPSLQGLTLADGQLLYQICLDASSTTTGTFPIRLASTPVAIEVVDVGGTVVPATMQDGAISITCTNTEEEPSPSKEPLSMFLETVSANCGEQACMNVKTVGFTSLLSFQHSLRWDPALLGSATVQGFGISDLNATNFNLNTAGQLRVGWDDTSLQGVSLTDNAVLYQVCFTPPTPASGNASVEFSDTPLSVEVVDIGGSTIRPDLQNGLVSITCTNPPTGGGNTGGGTPTGTLSFSASDASVTCGNEACLDVRVAGFEDILAFQYTMRWDPTILGMGEVRQFGIADLGIGNFNNTTPGVLRVGWDDTFISGVTLPDNEIIYQVCFETIGDVSASSLVEFVGIPTSVEVVNMDGQELTPTFRNGTIGVSCEGGNPNNTGGNNGEEPESDESVGFSISDVTAACGGQVCADVTVENFTDILSFQYTLAWDPQALGAATVQQIGLPDLNPTNFNVANPGVLRVGWDDTFLSGVTLADNSIIYQLCFDVIGDKTENTTVRFTGIPTSIEVVDKDSRILSTNLEDGVILIDCTNATVDNDNDGFTADVDCDDNNPTINPGAQEFPNNNVDEDCDGVAQFIDNDNDGWNSSIDCDDNNPNANGGATEIPDNGIDEDCDGVDLVTFVDNDGDGFPNTTDCDDNNPRINPGATEQPNTGFDENCDGISLIIDNDNDGWNSSIDCDDNNPNANGGATEIPNNGIDEDCDGVDLVTFIDNDGDGFPSTIDCNDNDPTINPGAQEFPNNNVDEDCDGIAQFIDNDNDGWNSSIDCDDNNPNANGGATEIPDNGIDEDCDGVDLVTFIDNDGDGFPTTTDCDDNNPRINPGATEQPNSGFDENCDGISVIIDNDNDGWNSSIDCDDNNPNANGAAIEIPNNGIDENCDGADLVTFADNDNDGFLSNVDCDDNNAQVNPDAAEIPNSGFDENCDGISLIIDNDNDGWNSSIDCDDTNPNINPRATEIPNSGFDENCDGISLIIDNDNDRYNSSIDCDDNNPNINGAATEIPNNGIDEDCDGEDLVTVIFTDNDNDGFDTRTDCDDTNPNINPRAAEIPNSGIDENCDGVSLIIDNDNDGFNSSIDCDDNNPNINGRATEIPNNGIDENCDGADLITTVFPDNDNDGFDSSTDCNDNNPNINPGVAEIPNSGFDENCDGISLIIDNDNDGFNSSIDCDDANPNINGGAAEIPNNGIDENCDGADLTTLTDNDRDGFLNDVDCNDNDPNINPGRAEIPNSGFDENCDGISLIIDNDNDGFNSSIDCDDTNPNINGGAAEIPNNGIDENCDGADLTTLTDNDNDGFLSDVDCNDGNPSINPGVAEIPNSGFDENCDGVSLIIDEDNDGFNSSIDCNDNNPAINPNAVEITNSGIDENCDGVSVIIDNDNDGFNSSIDCNDNNPNINGGAAEIPNNGIDEDCDGADLFTLTDNDSDGFFSDVDCDDNNPNINPGRGEIPNSGFDENCDGVSVVIDNDNDGFNSSIDCDDTNPNINGGAAEIPNNGIDEDCNGSDLVTVVDNDGDGFPADQDCNDNDPNINPGIKEVENNDIDENCDGLAEQIDVDNDGFNSDDDCDDNNPAINPGALDLPDNGIDEDCDGADAVNPTSGPIPVKMLLASNTAQCGTQVCLDVTVRDFTNIISFQYSINWNPDHLGAATVSNFGISDLGNSNFNNSVEGQLRVGWDDSSIQGVSLTSDLVLFTLCFDAISTTSVNAPVTFTNTPLAIEVVDANGELGMFQFQDGMIQINCGGLTDGASTQLKVSNQQQLNDISIYPNPVHTELTIQLDYALVTEGTIRIYDVWGQLLYNRNIENGTNQVQLPMDSFVAGLYFVELVSGEDRFRERVIKR